MNCPNPKDIRTEFDSLEIRKLRHQLASHSLDFIERGENNTQAFVPVRVGLNGFSCTVTENRGDETRTVKLDEAINHHCEVAVSVLDRIYEKSIRTIFKGQDHKIEEFSAKLKDLRFERDGNIIFRVNTELEQSEIRLVFVERT